MVPLTSVALSLMIACILCNPASGFYDYNPSDYYDYYDSYSTDGAMFASIFTILLFWFLVWFIIGILVYRDAERRKKNGLLWFFVILLLGLIGLVVWLIVRPPLGKEGKRYCSGCGREIPFDAMLCPYCGRKFEDLSNTTDQDKK